jgi:hypothetical protein
MHFARRQTELPSGIFRPRDPVLSSRLFVPWSGRPRPDGARLLAQIAAARFMSTRPRGPPISSHRRIVMEDTV